MSPEKSNPLIFFKIKIEPELISQIDKASGLYGGKTALISDALDLFVQNRLAGKLPSRYFASPVDGELHGLWIKRETVEHIKQLAEIDKQKNTRIIYTALARFFEADEN